MYYNLKSIEISIQGTQLIYLEDLNYIILGMYHQQKVDDLLQLFIGKDAYRKRMQPREKNILKQHGVNVI